MMEFNRRITPHTKDVLRAADSGRSLFFSAAHLFKVADRKWAARNVNICQKSKLSIQLPNNTCSDNAQAVRRAWRQHAARSSAVNVIFPSFVLGAGGRRIMDSNSSSTGAFSILLEVTTISLLTMLGRLSEVTQDQSAECAGPLPVVHA